MHSYPRSFVHFRIRGEKDCKNIPYTVRWSKDTLKCTRRKETTRRYNRFAVWQALSPWHLLRTQTITRASSCASEERNSRRIHIEHQQRACLQYVDLEDSFAARAAPILPKEYPQKACSPALQKTAPDVQIAHCVVPHKHSQAQANHTSTTTKSRMCAARHQMLCLRLCFDYCRWHPSSRALPLADHF